MKINKVTTIFDEFRLKDVEDSLIRHGVKGFTLHPVRGRGHYFDSFNENHLIKHIQMEVYAKQDPSEEYRAYQQRVPMFVPARKNWRQFCNQSTQDKE
ncbi:MAG: hypothetical protein QNK31_05780 [Porticoccus sp.]|nr:hypothetical protein [Porticoccus sp.]